MLARIGWRLAAVAALMLSVAEPAQADDAASPAADQPPAPAAARAIEPPATGGAESANSEDLPAESAAAPAELAAEEQPPEEASAGDEVEKLYPAKGEEWLQDPFLVLDMEMEAVVADLEDGKMKPPSQVTQPRVVSRLDTLIELLEKKCGGGGGGGGNNSRPAERTTLAKGPGGMGELAAPKTVGKKFDDLTPKEREKILQSKNEGFPPGFEDVLADYFRRLAKAEGADNAEDAAAAPAAEAPGATPAEAPAN